MNDPAKIVSNGGKWQFRLALAHDLFLKDQRGYLPWTREGYSVRLELGADDGKARKYDVHVNWAESAEDDEAALKSVALYVFEV